MRIETTAFGDERYDELAFHAGLADADHARGKMARLWRQCTLEKRYQLDPDLVNRVLGPRGVDAICRARLGTLMDDGTVRIHGTKGRIEWLDRLQSNGKKGGRPKGYRNKPSGYQDHKPSGSPDPNPLALALSPALSLSPSQSDPERRESAAFAAPPRSKKPKFTEAETAGTALLLSKLTRWNGIAYRGSDTHVALVAARMREGVTVDDMRKVVAYVAHPSGKGWSEDPKMKEHLCPETLFGPRKIDKYLDAARAWFTAHYGDQEVAA